MEVLTILMIILATTLYIVSTILNRNGLMYICLVATTLSLSSVLIDKTLTNDELMVAIFMPMQLVIMSAISLSMGRDKQW